jgi:large repetitive protein
MSRKVVCWIGALWFGIVAAQASAQPLLKSAVQVNAGNTIPAGQTFGYRLTYNCSSTSGPCLNSEVDDLLPAQVQYVSTVPASPTGDVAAINVTNNYMGSGRTRVQFVMNSPLTAGNSGDLLINVRFPDGSTANGTTAVNTADAINLSATPGTFTTPPVTVTATAALDATLTKTLLTNPANLDMPVSYRLSIAVPSGGGDLELTAIGPVTDTLPTGVVFSSASPAADCEPGCDGTTPASITWTSPCSVPVGSGSSCNIQVNVVYPSATFTSGTSVTNSFTATGTPLGGTPQSLGTGHVTHTVTTFVPNPSAGLGKDIPGGSPNPPTLNQAFTWELTPSDNGNVPLDTMVFIDTVPVQLQIASVTTGAYNSAADFAAGVGVQVSYEKNTAPGTFTLWGSSPNTTTNTTLTYPPPGLGAGEYVTRIEWQFGQVQAGMNASTRPAINGQIVNPDNAGNPVAFGNSIQNCAALTAVYTAGPTNVSHNVCSTFTLSGPFVQLNPEKDNLSGGGPFNQGQTVNWRLRVRSAPQSSDPAPLAGLVAADLLPVDLVYSGSWTFDDQGTGLPAPQTFEEIPNFAGTGRTLLRWTWTAGSGDLGVNQEVFILYSTTVRSGATFGPLSNTLSLTSNNPGLALRCSGSSSADTLNISGDGTSQTLCNASGTINVAPIAQLVSNKQVRGTCDSGFTATSNGTLVGGALQYQLTVENVGTVPMQNMVMIDILPFVGDTGVRDTSPRGSTWTPLLAAPILPPAGTILYYSTSGNPCRPEVGGPTSSCDPPNWTTVAPVPITSVRSFKVDFGSRVIGAFDSLSFTFNLTTPGNLPAGSAYNSFAYQANRADGLGSLAAEPQKVGVAAGTCTAGLLGDFVWVDTNKNGLQDDGPTGLNGVNVRLYSPGADGLPGTPDDVLLATSVTQPGPTSAPGWYNFPGLAAGSYLVCVTAPPTFIFTIPNQGTAGNNSVANQVTGCSPVVTLATGGSNLNVDFGLQDTQTASLGDYVWFDRNADGLQNESTWDGANGVTVKLWVDNGDGIAQPGTGDSLVATTLTADDVYGRPGYYRFDNLVPGLSYYVQFILPAAATGFTTQHAGTDTTMDSDASQTNGVTQMVVLTPGEYNNTLDAGLIAATGTLAIGDQVWLDSNNNGIYEPQNGEAGIDNVRLDLYLDANGDGLPTVGEYAGSTFTSTSGGFAGRYQFDNLAAGKYIVVVDPVNFTGNGALAGMISSTGNDPAPSPNTCTDGVDKGTPIGALIGTLQFTLTAGQTNCGTGGPNTNFTVDFGFLPSAGTPPPMYDYGDAPDNGTVGPGSYNTTALNNGPYHLLGVKNAPFLGHCVDADTGFNQGYLAKADDETLSAFVVGTCGPSGNDEDGVVFSNPFTPGGTASFTVTAGGPVACVLNAWVDWNGDGVFGDSAGEQIATDLTVSPGTPAVLTPTVPAGAVPGVTYARFRCSTATGLGPTGPAPDGEVEDYAVSIVGYDYGDAPQTYGTAGAGAARHKVDPLAPPLMLGQCVDTEPDGQPSVGADGDDTHAGTSRIGNCFNDEDGVTFPTPIVACAPAQVSVFVTGTGGKLDAWMDFAQSGTFSTAGNQIFTSQAVTPGVNLLTFTVPCSAKVGTSYARFRLSSAGGLGPTGTANDGEVEDYLITLVEHPLIGLAKEVLSVTPDPSVAGDSQVTFLFTVENMGNVALSNVNVVDNLVATFVAPASFTVTGISSTTLPVNAAFNGNSNTSLLAAGATLAVGQTATITVTVHAHSGGFFGPYTNTATASGVSPAAATVTDVSQNGTNPDPDGDGNPGNNNQPTIFDLPTSIAQIPTLTPWGAAILVLLLALAAWHQLRRRRRA